MLELQRLWAITDFFSAAQICNFSVSYIIYTRNARKDLTFVPKCGIIEVYSERSGLMRRIRITIWMVGAMIIMSTSAVYTDVDALPIEYSEPAVTATEYLEVPVSRGLQDFTRSECDVYGVPYELVIAIMEVESEFDFEAKSSTNDYGVMQINKVNHAWLKERFGFEDILEPVNNIRSGVHIIGTAYKQYGDLHKALMVYNHGDKRAKEYWANGIVESDYSRKVYDAYEYYREVDSN